MYYNITHIEGSDKAKTKIQIFVNDWIVIGAMHY